MEPKSIICLTLAFSVFSLTGAFVIIGVLGLLILSVACIKVWFRVDDLAKITEPLGVAVTELKVKVDDLEQKIKDE